MDTGGISLASFEISLWSVSTLPFGIDRKGARGGAVSEHNLWLTPIDMRVMFSEPSIAKDDIVMSQVRDVESDNFVVLLVHMARRTLWVILPLTLVVSSAFRTMSSVQSFSVFMLYFSTSFQWMKLVLAPLFDEGVFLDAALPFLRS